MATGRRWGTAAEADFLKVKSRTLVAWRSRKQGPAFVKIGRTVFYRQADLDAWILAQRRVGEKPI